MSDIHNEAGVKREVKKLLAKYGWFVWLPPANGYGKAGISDFHALRKGKFLAIETKYGGNTITALQARFLQDIELAGGWAVVVNDTAHSMELFEKFLESMA